MVCVTVLALWRRCPYLLVGWFWYVGMLVPVIGLVQVGLQAMADRYTYLPQIGLCMALVWGTSRAMRSWPHRAWWGGVGAALTVATLMMCAWWQTSFWQNSETLWTRDLDCAADNNIARNNLGVFLHDQGRDDEAIVQYRRALEIAPRYVDAYNNLGIALRACGSLDEAQAHFRRALELKPDSVDAHVNLGNYLMDCGRTAEALEHYYKAAYFQPGDVWAHLHLARALDKLGRIDDAIAECRNTLALDPNLLDVYGSLARMLADRGQPAEAIGLLRKALTIKPDQPAARYNLGLLLYQQGELSEAMAQWSKVLSMYPENAEALNQLAWVMATAPEASGRDGVKAVAMAQRAVKLTEGREPNFLDTLAAAQAEAGQFAEAVRTAKQALELASGPKNAVLAEGIQARIRLYEAEAPFRDARQPPPPPTERPSAPAAARGTAGAVAVGRDSSGLRRAASHPKRNVDRIGRSRDCQLAAAVDLGLRPFYGAC